MNCLWWYGVRFVLLVGATTGLPNGVGFEKYCDFGDSTRKVWLSNVIFWKGHVWILLLAKFDASFLSSCMARLFHPP
jgi:hypothetical protein